MRRFSMLLLLCVVPMLGCSQARFVSGRSAIILEEQPLFVSGADGYHTYRIPALIATTKGTVLAFCEGRRNSSSDTGDIDILLRRSIDGGRTWAPAVVVADHGPDTIGNPCPVVDRRTGIIHLLLTGNPGRDHEKQIMAGTASGTRTVWVTRSLDDGLSWSTPAEITAHVKPSTWGWYATGPGCGIQLRNGRLIVPCDHSMPPNHNRSHVICSDDGGFTWRLGGITGDGVNECQVVQRQDGSLLLNMRNSNRRKGQPHFRAIATSSDGGESWSEITHDQTLLEPVCQASLLYFTRTPGSARNRLLFANPASKLRDNLTIKLSYDEGHTWPVAKTLHPGPSAYCALVNLPDDMIGCLYERGQQHPYETLTFARFSLAWLTDGTDRE